MKQYQAISVDLYVDIYAIDHAVRGPCIAKLQGSSRFIPWDRALELGNSASFCVSHDISAELLRVDKTLTNFEQHHQQTSDYSFCQKLLMNE